MSEYKKEMEKTQKQISDIHAVLLGSTEEGRTTTGLVAEVKEHRKFIRFWEKFVWAVIVAGALDIIAPHIKNIPEKQTVQFDQLYKNKQELVDDLNKKMKGRL